VQSHDLYSSLNVVRAFTRGTTRCGWCGGNKNTYGVLVRKLEGKRPLGRPRCTWEDNVKVDRK
jgi:hypothetical protein